ncbi:hypothetical protein [Egicoccus sp. AB-alg2]|uniref:hypothetical protein n=1 Tax=Egicoccus sp. AB-alg2 TaxID=3242693 RepID=UPI00359ED058
MATELHLERRDSTPWPPPARRRRRAVRLAASTFSSVLLLGAIGWAGLHLEPDPFPSAGVTSAPVSHLPIPGGLPEPVDRFYRTLYGNQIPVVETVVISGRGHPRIAGITFPARFRFSHVAGRSYATTSS